MGMNRYESKVMTFMTALSNAYKDEDDVEYIGKLELVEDELTEDFTAMLFAMMLLYTEITGDKTDIIGFTHVLNRLAVQKCVDKEDN